MSAEVTTWWVSVLRLLISVAGRHPSLSTHRPADATGDTGIFLVERHTFCCGYPTFCTRTYRHTPTLTANLGFPLVATWNRHKRRIFWFVTSNSRNPLYVGGLLLIIPADFLLSHSKLSDGTFDPAYSCRRCFVLYAAILSTKDGKQNFITSYKVSGGHAADYGVGYQNTISCHDPTTAVDIRWTRTSTTFHTTSVST